ncbi:MAG: hypothetical protein KME46_27870 [Brasilonema angustatum HA4187-MV1]|nr:hypothetical protein [Brasilonema angustatum HA4187-MV1]
MVHYSLNGAICRYAAAKLSPRTRLDMKWYNGLQLRFHPTAKPVAKAG